MNLESHIISNLLFWDKNLVYLPRLKANWFTEVVHQKVVMAMQELYLSNSKFGLYEIVNHIGKEHAYEVSLLMNKVMGNGEIEHNIKELQYKAMKKELIDKLSNLDLQRDLNAITNDLERYVEESKIVHAKESVQMQKVTGQVFDQITYAIERGQSLSGLPTGWHKLDSVIGGWNKSDMVIIAGRPGSGKTAIALSFVRNAAELGAKCLFLSLEMSKEQIAKRYMSLLAEIPQYKLRSGNLNQSEISYLANKIVTDEVMFHIDDEAIVDIQTIKSKVKIHKAKHGLNLLVIDYLQLIKGNKQNREQEISDISRNLKVLAKELEITVIALAQLSRKCEERADKRPLLSDIRESGSIEQDADIILFPFRPNYYDRADIEIEEAELIIAKNRHGEVGMIKTTFTPARTLYQEQR
jgi:replicative DNA helicase